MHRFVALDLETTGLDTQRDAIIEIAAVRFVDGRPTEHWATLVYPQRPIPDHITRITGIHDGMVAAAPSIEEVTEGLQAFVGQDVLVGHNIQKFDLAFLRVQGLFHQHPVVDTLRAAEVLLPRSPSYALGYLAQTLGLPIQPEHRALADAEATGWLFLALCARASELPKNLLLRLLHWARAVRWPGVAVLECGLRKHRGPESVPLPPTFPSLVEKSHTRPPKAVPHPLESPALLGPEGPLPQVLPGYEFREGQQAMSEAVAEALTRGEHLMVEAGTGTGKSLAYLIPAALWAAHHNEPVVISTFTRSLQDQLLEKDIPLVRAALGWPGLRAVALKGRRNYLCPRRLYDMYRIGPRDEDEFRVLARVLLWLAEGGSGVADDLTLQPQDMPIWQMLNAEDEGCTAKTCVQSMEGICPFYRARRAAQEAHLVVVNHALLMSDVVGGYRVLPSFSRLIVDEAHHLENAATEALTVTFSSGEWRAWMRKLGHQRQGLLGRLLFFFQREATPEAVAQVRGLIQDIVAKALHFQESLKTLERPFVDYLIQLHPRWETYRYDIRYRLTPETYALPWWEDVQHTWRNLREHLFALHTQMEQLVWYLGRLQHGLSDPDLQEQLEDFQNHLLTLDTALLAIVEHLQALFVEGESRYGHEVHWVEWHPKKGWLRWIRAPRHVATMLRTHLWEKKATAVLTSATLRVADSFAFLQDRLGLYEARTLVLPSPFDYPNQALVYVVRDMPMPNGPQHSEVLAQALIPVVEAAHGRTMVLFTAYASMLAVANRLRPLLEALGIRLLVQDEGRSVQSLVQAFRQGQPAVLLGTRSLWEGIDIPGPELSVLVLAKLPFGVPDDPLHAARAEMYRDPFTEYSLPDAVLAFLQGFGRLIRTREDRGVVVLFDPRVLTRPYGQVFLRSLPRVRLLQGSWKHLAAVIQQWLE